VGLEMATYSAVRSHRLQLRSHQPTRRCFAADEASQKFFIRRRVERMERPCSLHRSPCSVLCISDISLVSFSFVLRSEITLFPSREDY